MARSQLRTAEGGCLDRRMKLESGLTKEQTLVEIHEAIESLLGNALASSIPKKSRNAGQVSIIARVCRSSNPNHSSQYPDSSRHNRGFIIGDVPRFLQT